MFIPTIWITWCTHIFHMMHSYFFYHNAFVEICIIIPLLFIALKFLLLVSSYSVFPTTLTPAFFIMDLNLYTICCSSKASLWLFLKVLCKWNRKEQIVDIKMCYDTYWSELCLNVITDFVAQWSTAMSESHNGNDMPSKHQNQTDMTF